MKDILVVGSDELYTPYLLKSLATESLAKSLGIRDRIHRINVGSKISTYEVAKWYVRQNAGALSMAIILDHHNVEGYARSFVTEVRASARPDIPILSCSGLSLLGQWRALAPSSADEWQSGEPSDLPVHSGIYAFTKTIDDATDERAHDLALILNKYLHGAGDLSFVIRDEQRNRKLEEPPRLSTAIEKGAFLSRDDDSFTVAVRGRAPLVFSIKPDGVYAKLTTLDLLSDATYVHAHFFQNYRAKIVDDSDYS